MNFVNVILPLPLNRQYTYALTDSQAGKLKPGMRIAVPFGKTKVYTAIATKIHQEKPRLYETKYIEEILDSYPLVTTEQLWFFTWMADYYMCGEGEVLRAALPSAFLLQSETVVELNTEEDIDSSQLTDEEFLIFEALQAQAILRIHEVIDLLGKKGVLPILNAMVDKKVIIVNQELYKKYQPKMVRFVRMTDSYTGEKLKEILEDLRNAPKQRAVIMKLFTLQAQLQEVKVKELQDAAQASPGVIKTLADKGLVEEYYLQEDRIQSSTREDNLLLFLSEEQKRALREIKDNFSKDLPCLLHGITSSGKTEIYIRLIEEVLEKGQQVLYLLPEIALTTQLIMRLQMYFGEEVLVYHSKYSVNERVEVYKHVLNQSKGKIVVGVRSSLFLPFQNLGLIVVDESHETTFKQFDPAPRYQARDAAVVLGRMSGAKVLLGTATPGLETYFNTRRQKYGLVNLKQRFGKVIPPKIQLVDIKEKYKQKKMQSHFSDELIRAISETLADAKQVILFQNRRGYAPVLECQTCGHSPQCTNCDVSLTYHKHNNSLRCHYCGYQIAVQKKCLVCGSVDLTTKGLGTEQVEKELKDFFPNHKTGRMDLDTTRGKYGYEKIITAFQQREIDILVGTQMLAKGLDFRNVDLVGVMNADNLLNFPDFRAHERAYQLLTQVSGRAGRTDKQGRVLIQTYNPKHPILQYVIQDNYEDFYEDQLQGRIEFNYPPLYKLIKITFRARNYNRVNEASDWVAKGLRTAFGKNVLGPEFPAVARIRNEYNKVILLKIPPQQSLSKTKRHLQKTLNSYETIAAYRSVRVILNVDPY